MENKIFSVYTMNTLVVLWTCSRLCSQSTSLYQCTVLYEQLVFPLFFAFHGAYYKLSWCPAVSNCYSLFKIIVIADINLPSLKVKKITMNDRNHFQCELNLNRNTVLMHFKETVVLCNYQGLKLFDRNNYFARKRKSKQ